MPSKPSKKKQGNYFRMNQEYAKDQAGKVSRHNSPHVSKNSKTYKDKDDLRGTEGFVDKLSPKTAFLALYLLHIWQTRPKKVSHRDKKGMKTDKNGKVYVKIGELAEAMNTRNDRIKDMLVVLAGYRQKFRIYEKFRMDEKNFKGWSYWYKELIHIAPIIHKGEEPVYGTDKFWYSKGEPVQIIRFHVDNIVDEGIQDDASYTLLDKKVFDDLGGLDSMALKLFFLTGKHSPFFKLSFDVLVREDYLNLEDRVKKKGRPHMISQIKKGLETLSDHGHIIHWEFEEEREMFSIRYGDKYIKHKAFNPDKTTRGLEPRTREEFLERN